MINWWYGINVTKKYLYNVNEVLNDEEKIKYPYKIMNYHHNLKNVIEIDNTSIMPSVKDQGNLGSCTANAICTCYESQMIKLENLYIPMSRLFLYYLEREREGTVDTDSGAQIKDGVTICNDTGLCLESMWEYDVSKFTEKPPSECYDDLQHHKAVKIERVKKSFDDIDQCLLDGHIIVMGFRVYESFEKIKSDGLCPIPDVNKEKFLGGHAVAIFKKTTIGGKPKYGIRNSWSSSWGNQGNFYVDPEFLTYTFGVFNNTPLCNDLWTITAGNILNDTI
jgi:C1A family cysteine protease